MTEKEFKEKYKEITDWYIRETDKITKILEKENKIHGLDTNKKEYAKVFYKFQNKTNELKEEYHKYHL